jgi:uncharacterized protein YgiB involved in biofilm formation
MRKPRPAQVKPLILAIAATVGLSACGGDDYQEAAQIYRDVDHCIRDNPGQEDACRVAYDEAQKIAFESGPKYSSAKDCEAEFGANQCVDHRGVGGTNWFVPLMAGFLLSDILDGRRYRSAPLYTSYSSGSGFYNRWTTVDGYSYGQRRYGKVKVDKNTFASKPAVTRTISRGGFGSTVAAKSKWSSGKSSRSGRSSSRGWGG